MGAWLYIQIFTTPSFVCKNYFTCSCRYHNMYSHRDCRGYVRTLDNESGLYDHHSETLNAIHVGLCSSTLFLMYIHSCPVHKDSIVCFCKPSGGLGQRSGRRGTCRQMRRCMQSPWLVTVGGPCQWDEGERRFSTFSEDYPWHIARIR